MSLDLHQTALQITEMAFHLRQRQGDRRARLQTGLATLAAANADQLEAKRQASKLTWLVPGPVLSQAEGPVLSKVEGAQGTLAARTPGPPAPASFTVLAVDGSHIEVDRHSPARCYLLNLGLCRLSYGPYPTAHLSSRPALYARDEDLALADPASHLESRGIEGPLLGLVRTVAEVQALADTIEALPGDEPVLALLDGSLILWGLAGRDQPDFVRRHILDDGLLPALDRLRQAADSRPLALAAYISLPGSREVVNLLRLHHCPYQPANCDAHCRQVPPGRRGCDPVDGLLDRDLFAAHLQPDERSPLFATTSSIVASHYGPHQVHFFYLHVGHEIARVELPAWVANDPQRLALAHALLLDQARKGEGYPVAISEAHEQAVVTGPDRDLFQQLVLEALEGERLPVSTSQKSRSKRTKWV